MKLLAILLYSITTFASIQVQETEKCPAHSTLSKEESFSLINQVHSESQRELINQYDLRPKVFFQHHNIQVSLSKKFSRVEKERYHVLAYIKIGNEVFPRLVYHSNSHGVYRVLDGILDGWYSKGPGQNYISVPFFINKFLLENCIGESARRTKAELRELLEFGDDHLYYFNNYEVFEENIVSVLKGPAKPPLLDGNGMSKRHPEDIFTKDGYEANFMDVKAKYKTTTKAAGLVNVVVYRSTNKKIDYTFMIDSAGKAWVSEVNSFIEELNKFGIAKKQYDVKDLLQPRWEYPEEIVVDYRSSISSPYKSSYRSNWNYLREIPLIKKWYEYNKLPLPIKEPSL
ncbi:hypothetical protein [Halobacteriovorax sp. HLS]|uniref:hypothetical protein n=1 Tax=Halobacteriovorax sp. HLS TaxID=2234000 RepID=UPI000FD9D741|nr:hypothetical protein [Halobacteriovorax sp. HLS]